MKEKTSATDPPSYRQSQSFRQSYAGTSLAKSVQDQASSEHADRQKAHPEGEILPMELKALIDRYGTWLAKHHSAVTTIATLAIFVATAIYTVFASLQWLAMRKSNRINHDSLIAVQRAFVDGKGTGSKRFANQLPSGEQWVFEENFVNDGTTPAIDVSNIFNLEEIPNGLTEERFIGNLKDVAKARKNIGTIGPKGQHTIGPLFKTEDFVLSGNTMDFKNVERLKAFKQTRDIYAWGWVTYRDIFPDTPIHLTEFCQHLAGISLNPQDKTISVYFNNCSEHNCTDKYCKDYAEIVSAVLGENTPVVEPADLFGVEKTDTPIK